MESCTDDSMSEKPSSIPSPVQFCMICLDIDSKLYPTSKYYLDIDFDSLTGISLQAETRFVPQLCTECAQRLVNCAKFRRKSLSTYHLLTDLLEKQGELTMDKLKTINRSDNHLTSNMVTKVFKANHYDLKLVDNTVTIEDIVKIEETKASDDDNDSSKYLRTFDDKSNDDYLGNFRNAEYSNDDDEIIYNDVNSDIEYLEDDIDDVVQALANDDSKQFKDYNRNDDSDVEYLYLDDFGNLDETIESMEDYPTSDTYTKSISGTVRHKIKYGDGKNDDPTSDTDYKSHLSTVRHKMKYGNGKSDSNQIVLKDTKSKLYTQVNVLKRKSGEHKVILMDPSVNDRGDRIKGAFYERDTGKRVSFIHDKLQFEDDSDGDVGMPENKVKKEPYLSVSEEDEEEKYMCPYCGDEFRHKNSYMKHVCSRTIMDKVCPFCGFSFIGDRGLKMHLVRKHRYSTPIDTEKLEGPTCEQCNIRFATAEAYVQHKNVSPKHGDVSAMKPIRVSQRKTHRGPRGYAALDCEYCGTRLTSVREYSKHAKKCVFNTERAQYKQRSTNGSTLICEHCGKTFQNEQLLKEHVVIHSGLKPYKCNICQKSFTFKMNLTRHRHLHLESRPRYQCVECGQEFAHKQNTWRHMMTIHNAHPQLFKCDMCGKMLTTSESREQHVRHVHLGVPWPKRVHPRPPHAVSRPRLVRHTKRINASVAQTAHASTEGT